MKDENTKKIIISISIIVVVIVSIVLWHPWINVTGILMDFQSDVEEGIPYANFDFDLIWQQLGYRVVIYVVSPGSDSIMGFEIGWFDIDLFGNTDMVHTEFGDFHAWW